MSTFGINVVSSFTQHYSVTYVAYSLVDSLLEQNVPVDLLNVRIDGDRAGGAPKHIEQRLVSGIEQLRNPITLYVFPATVQPAVMKHLPKLANTSKLHICDLQWEFNTLPDFVANELNKYDGVLCHSEFLTHLATTHAPTAHVIKAPHVWNLPQGITPDRKRFGVPLSGTAFLFVFDADSEAGTIDPLSGNGRKNLFELIQVFQAAFPSTFEDAHLVIRATNLDKAAHTHYREQIFAAAKNDPRIYIIPGHLSYSDLMCLVSSCDVYVSLHRAEGFGLGMLEAMGIGKPVIATAWSGNMSFMNHTNSCLVRCLASPLPKHYRYFGMEMPLGTVWAAPIRSDAISYMRLLHRDPVMRDKIGQEASKAYEKYQAAAKAREWIQELRALHELRAFRPHLPGKYSSSVERSPLGTCQ
jgi:glycosyltransferase involved in cell wall biosynthesis